MLLEKAREMTENRTSQKLTEVRDRPSAQFLSPCTRLIRCPAGAPSPVGASPPGFPVGTLRPAGATHVVISHLSDWAAASGSSCAVPPLLPPPRLGPLSPPRPETPGGRWAASLGCFLGAGNGEHPGIAPVSPRAVTGTARGGEDRPYGTVTALAKRFTTTEEGANGAGGGGSRAPGDGGEPAPGQEGATGSSAEGCVQPAGLCLLLLVAFLPLLLELPLFVVENK